MPRFRATDNSRSRPIHLEDVGTCTLDEDGCTTCGDVAVPVRVLVLSDRNAQVEDRLGQRAEVATDFVPEVRVGDIVLVHMGVAIARAEAL